MAFSYARILVGLKYPFHPLLTQLLEMYNIAITQLMPNTIKAIMSFEGWCNNKSITLNTFFSYCFTIGMTPKSPGYLQLSSSSLVGRVFRGTNSSNKGWKNQFFFIRSVDPSRPLNLPTAWNTSSVSSYKLHNLVVARDS